MNTTKTNQELSEHDKRLLIINGAEATIQNNQGKLFNYAPFPRSTVDVVLSMGPQLHLSIEQSMKSLLKTQGKEAWGHDLGELLGRMIENDKAFLNKAFEAAIRFYQIDSSEEGMCHTESLEEYLRKTGTCGVFNRNRYLLTDKPQKDEPSENEVEENEVEEIIKLIPAIHLELLYAMLELLEPVFDEPRTVNDRVEHSVWGETSDNARADMLPYDGTPNCAIWEFKRWIDSHGTRRDAMAAAIKQEFQISDHPEINEHMRTGCENLKELDDPAVRFFVDQAEGRMYLDPKGRWVRGPISRGKDGKP